jgi:hypothetical protein
LLHGWLRRHCKSLFPSTSRISSLCRPPSMFHDSKSKIQGVVRDCRQRFAILAEILKKVELSREFSGSVKSMVTSKQSSDSSSTQDSLSFEGVGSSIGRGRGGLVGDSGVSRVRIRERLCLGEGLPGERWFFLPITNIRQTHSASVPLAKDGYGQCVG